MGRMWNFIRNTSAVKIFNSKMGAALLILLALTLRMNGVYLAYVKEKDYPITWCIFPFFLSSYLFLVLFFCGVVYVHSDAPFLQHASMYQVIRTGRKRWALGQVAGIFVRSLALSAATAVFTVLPFLGRLELSADWGKMAYTLAAERPYYSELYSSGLYYRFIYTALQKNTPLGLMLMAFTVCVLICTFLGVLLFLCGLFIGKGAAVAVCLTQVLLLFFVENQFSHIRAVSWLVPVYWAEVALLDYRKSAYYRLPPLAYIYAALLISIAAMTAIICRKVQKMEFYWENEDA